MPLRIETPAGGLVRVRGAEVQGIDWPASGPSSVIVPLMIYSESVGDLELTVNDKPVRLPRRPMEASAPWASQVEEIDPRRPEDPPLSAISDRAYDAAAGWKGGRGVEARRSAAYAAVAIVLLFGAVTLIRSKRLRVAAAIALSIGCCTAIGSLWTLSPDRTSVIIEHRATSGQIPSSPTYDRTDIWTFYVSRRPTALRVEWGSGMHILINAPQQLERVAPVLTCDATGRPVFCDVHLPADETVAVLRLAADARDIAVASRDERRIAAIPFLRRVYRNSVVRAAN